MTYRHIFLIAALSALLAGPGLAQTTETEITVRRGVEQQQAPTVAGVTIYRGEPGRQPVRPPPKPEKEAITTSGRHFWIFDQEENKLTACDFRQGLNVGSRRIRCFTRGLRF